MVIFFWGIVTTLCVCALLYLCACSYSLYRHFVTTLCALERCDKPTFVVDKSNDCFQEVTNKRPSELNKVVQLASDDGFQTVVYKRRNGKGSAHNDRVVMLIMRDSVNGFKCHNV